jgi:hypothetical protein
MNTSHPTTTESKTYGTEIERHCAEWEDRLLLRLRPMTEGTAREYLGMCNKHNRDTDIKEHFASEVQRLQ